MNIQKVKERFVDILGSKCVLDEDKTLNEYASDYTEESPRMPSMVLRPTNAEHIQSIVNIANDEKISINVLSNLNLVNMAVKTTILF